MMGAAKITTGSMASQEMSQFWINLAAPLSGKLAMPDAIRHVNPD